MEIHVPLSRSYLKYAAELNFKKQLAQQNWSFSKFRQELITSETPDWNQNYLPIDLKGKTVLSVGAGEGEDALFFLQHGAAKVVAVECNSDAYRRLKINAAYHNIEAVNEAFRLEHLKIPHDFLKVDIEGYEEALLNVKLDKPAVIEIHGLPLVERFRKAGWRIKNRVYSSQGIQRVDAGCTKYGYWKC